MSDRGVYRLAAAMLLQAIQDATSPSSGKRAGALRWMSSKEEECFSFAFVCRIVNRDPVAVRRFCERRAVQRPAPQLLFRALMDPPGEPEAARGGEGPAWRNHEDSPFAPPTAA